MCESANIHPIGGLTFHLGDGLLVNLLYIIFFRFIRTSNSAYTDTLNTCGLRLGFRRAMGGQGGVSCAVGEKKINLFEGEICRFGIKEVYDLFKLAQNQKSS